MPKTLTEKILESHLTSGKMIPQEEIGIAVDQTLTQDATGTASYLQFEAIGIPQVKTRLSVSYIDHNTLQTGFENADDHLYLQTAAARYGIYFSRAGNGICHQLHLERFSVPGQTLLGTDSHTPTCGGVGMLAIGAGGLDVAVAMGGGSFFLNMPEIINIKLRGKLPPWITAKDIILEILRRLTVRGGTGKVIEYSGDGLDHLSVPERATITNMGTELGATTSIFPSDRNTKKFLEAQQRSRNWLELAPDPGASYAETLEVNLEKLEPLVALPHSPDRVAGIREAGPVEVDQVAIGSCTNSSYVDLMRTAAILKGKTIHPRVSLVISPGSRQVLMMLIHNGAFADLIKAGARILEPACGPCIGMGQAPPSGAVSLRTFNRNFAGRSGTKDAQVYLCSPETAAASALSGRLTDPRELGTPIDIALPENFFVDDSMIIPPAKNPETVVIRKGPNIKPIPESSKFPPELEAKVLLKLKDNITTDDIAPAGAKILPLRSNIPAMSEYAFAYIDPDFAKRAKAWNKTGLIVGGHNYGQGSSREHAALLPMHLGIKIVLAKSFARIHKANLINFGILPLVFDREEDWKNIQEGDLITADNLLGRLSNSQNIVLTNKTQNYNFSAVHDLSPRLLKILQEGGLLNYTSKYC